MRVSKLFPITNIQDLVLNRSWLVIFKGVLTATIHLTSFKFLCLMALRIIHSSMETVIISKPLRILARPVLL